MKCDLDIRKEYVNVVMSGCMAVFQVTGERMTEELTALAPIHDEDHGGCSTVGVVGMGGREDPYCVPSAHFSCFVFFSLANFCLVASEIAVQPASLHRDHLHTIQDPLSTRATKKESSFFIH